MCVSQRQLQVNWSAADRYRSSVGCKRRWVDIVGSRARPLVFSPCHPEGLHPRSQQ